MLPSGNQNDLRWLRWDLFYYPWVWLLNTVMWKCESCTQKNINNIYMYIKRQVLSNRYLKKGILKHCVCSDLHTLSNLDVDVMGHLELAKRGHCTIALMGPRKQVLIAMRKIFHLHLTRLRKISCLKMHFRSLWNLRNQENKAVNIFSTTALLNSWLWSVDSITKQVCSSSGFNNPQFHVTFTLNLLN